MTKEAVFTLKLEEQLRADFMAATAEEHRPAAQVVRELMREFVRQKRDAQSYAEFLRRNVDAARERFARDEYVTNEEVEADAVKRRAELQQRVGADTRR